MKRKKNCNKTRLDRISRASISSLLICSLEGKPVRILDTRTGKFIRPNDTLTRAICHVHHKWSCVVAVHGRIESANENYMKTEQTAERHPRLQSNMISYLTDTLKATIDNFNPMHKINTGWIASPAGMDLLGMGDLAWDIFEEMGAWENKD